jgi:serine protease Do
VRRSSILVGVLAFLVLITAWFVFNPGTDVGTDEEMAESQETGNWNEPVVQVVERMGPVTVKIETVRDVLVDQFFFYQVQQQKGVGSGVIYREDGYILTNNHVVQDANEIVVRLPSGQSYRGEVVGRDALSDLAVLKVDAKGLPAATIGDSTALRVGQSVIAIGNPLGQDQTVTTGVISALNRDLLVDPEDNLFLEGMIQTDAAINPGNSGGPLLNQSGEVIGINTAIIQQAQGIGFAIPISTARNIADQIIEHGRPLRLGVLGGSLTPALAASIREQAGVELAVERGAFITRVLPDSPAAAAGLTQGDVITAVNGEEIAGMRELRDAVQAAGFGGKLALTYYRGGDQRQAEVTL